MNSLFELMSHIYKHQFEPIQIKDNIVHNSCNSFTKEHKPNPVFFSVVLFCLTSTWYRIDLKRADQFFVFNILYLHDQKSNHSFQKTTEKNATIKQTELLQFCKRMEKIAKYTSETKKIITKQKNEENFAINYVWQNKIKLTRLMFTHEGEHFFLVSNFSDNSKKKQNTSSK